MLLRDDPTHTHECSASFPSLSGLVPALTLQPMMPLRFHKGVDAALRIDRIEWLEIADVERNPTDHTMYYTIHIFTKKDQSRLPTSRLARKPSNQPSIDTMAKPTRTQPDFRIQRSFADFRTMRDDIMLAAQKSHGRYCHLCDDFLRLLTFSGTRPAMALQPVLPAGMKVKILQKLLHALVGQFQARLPSAGRRDGCQAAHDVPVTLHEFLFEDEQSV